ncbi:hypothetical protein HIM_02970 [Hirsutella minnesotensis 3608]|nr:hypothetical protein HIM_02970 [Hirsutella minnesotensis 3608]
MSSPCTYTLSSGIGAGKKRLRKVPAAASFRCAKKTSPSPSLSRPQSAVRTMHHDRHLSSGNTRTGEQRHASRSPISADTVETTAPNPSAGFCASEQPSFLPSPEPWAHLNMDVDPLLNGQLDSADSFLANDGFISMCPSKPSAHRGASQLPTPVTDRGPSLPAVGEAEVEDQSFMALLELTHSSDHGGSPTHSGQSRPISASPPYTASATLPHPRSPAQNLEFSPSSSTSNASQHCQCLFSLLRTLEDLGSPATDNATKTSTDDLFQCLEQGIEKCRSILSCSACTTRTTSPVLVVTIVNQLVIVMAELVNRFVQCQSRDTVPTVFQFGKYCVEHPALRTRLLKSMIELYVKDLQKVILRLQTSLAGKQGSILDDAKHKSGAIHQKLKDFAASDALINA